ncbi:DNA-binding response regulator [Butyrivibrio sp. CB08]|uniref:LytR/AlgR family response regulator transcription factor n=1 Tax=Butyrivibrio sp. CB08 TaxID=2364879 RepID=UPI000EA91ED0|nr:LytTR family DNA-binding domain-containing protein [Butyrivibrio sp. CB08]RKM55942.1 DNA-binding response regulator [Butyrivibrio sp. CB08]
MFKLAICDDEKSSAAEAAELLERYRKSRGNLDFETDIFYTSIDLLTAIEKKAYDIYLLDIYIDKINGIDIAKAIKKNNEDAHIIFMTSSNAFYKDAFRIHAVHYLEKPILEEDFFDAMDRVCVVEEDNAYYTFRDSGEVHRVPVSDILYVESEDHYKRIVVGDESFLVRSTMQEIRQELNEPFFYELGVKSLINLKKVLKITKDVIVMEDGKEFSVPRGKYRTVSEMVLKYTF